MSEQNEIERAICQLIELALAGMGRSEWSEEAHMIAEKATARVEELERALWIQSSYVAFLKADGKHTDEYYVEQALQMAREELEADDED